MYNKLIGQIFIFSRLEAHVVDVCSDQADGLRLMQTNISEIHARPPFINRMCEIDEYQFKACVHLLIELPCCPW